MRALSRVVALVVALAPAAAKAEFQLSIYGGANTANNGDATIRTPLVNGTFDIHWFGASFEAPPYYGARGTWWLTDFDMPRFGVAIDATHSKAKANLDDPTIGASFSHLEFTNGLNTITLNGIYRMPFRQRFTLYAGLGAGAAIPHVEVKTIPFQGNTYEYQLDGPAFQGLVGGSVNLGHGFSAFAEYKAVYTRNDADLVGGGTFKANVLTHQFAAGLSFSFGAPPPPNY